jgi:copper oxidase (laccase) domain-containing protein
LGATTIKAALGPCIHAECYEFNGPELDELARDFGDAVIGVSNEGTRALDMIAATRAACAAADVELEYVDEHCTACSTNPKYFSWRARKDTGRQAMVVWQPA